MAIAGGIPCNVDPLLYNVMKSHCGKVLECLMFVGCFFTCPTLLVKALGCRVLVLIGQFKTHADCARLPHFEKHTLQTIITREGLA